MNARQSLAGFDFSRYNRDYLSRTQTRTISAHGGNNGGSNSDSNATLGNERNDAADYGVRVVPAQVAPDQLYWRVIGVRHLEPAENRGKHNLYAELLDEDGVRVRDPNVQLERGWEGQRADEKAPLVGFDKGDNEPATNIPIDRNQQLWVRVASDLPSDKVENLHTKHADEAGPNGELWNSIGHHSFYVVFQRTRHAASTLPPLAETPTAETPVAVIPMDPFAVTPDVTVAPPHVAPPLVQSPAGLAPTPVDDAIYLEGRDAIPALAILRPGQSFEQRWRVQNSGSTTWGEGYGAVCVGGKPLNAPAHVSIPACAPGGDIAVAVPFTAPSAPGPHHSVWRMVNAHGEAFGERLWLLIVVETAPGAETVTAGDSTIRPTPRNVRPATDPNQPPWPPEVQTGLQPEPQPTGRLPEVAPTQFPGGASIADRDPELYAAWKAHIEHGFANNQLMFQQLLNGFMNPYWTTVWMYRILFGLGVASFVVAAGLSAFANKEGYTLVFGGLSALSLLAYFFNRPLQALEENLQFITWLGLIYNSYWTRLVYLNSQRNVQQGLQDATDDAITRIKELMDAHAKRSGKRAVLRE